MVSFESCVLFILSTLIPTLLGQDAGGDSMNSGYKHPDVEGERKSDMLIGVVVGVCLACVFLVILCITYNYYKHKPYRNVPRDVEEPLTARK